MRDKFLFIPSGQAPATHLATQASLVGLFAANKRSRKLLANLATDEVLSGLAVPGRDAHAVLHRYEQRYLSIGNWARMRNSVKLRFQNDVELEQVGDSTNVYATRGGVRAKVGMIFQEYSRFVRAANIPAVIGKDIYVRRGDPAGRQYIYIHHTASFVRRFVTRGLNGFDAMNLSTGTPLRAVIQDDLARVGEIRDNGHLVHHAVAAGVALTENQQILSHTRGWGGKKRYISTGVSNRPALSTRGTQFTSMYGAVTVDLALVDDTQIFDLHMPGTAGRFFDDADPRDVLDNDAHHTGTNDIAEQAYLAMRDVLRTRELLIKQQLPVNAVSSNSVGARLVGIGSLNRQQHEGVPGRVAALPLVFLNGIVNQEALSFIDPHTGRRWHFIEFQNPAIAQAAFGQLATEPTQQKIRFNQYRPARPAGMV